MNLPIDQVLVGDNQHILRTFPSECIDMVLTSPPYGNIRQYGGQSYDFEALAFQLYRTMKPGSTLVWVRSDETIDGSESGESFRQVLRFMALGFKLHDTMIYHKINYLPRNHRRCDQAFEFMFVLTKRDGPKTFNAPQIVSKKVRGGSKFRASDGRRKSAHSPLGVRETKMMPNVWSFKLGAETLFSRIHPATFPYELAMRHIQVWSDPGDVVLDPFTGSGCALYAAKQLQRHFVGIDVHQTYVDEARRILCQETLGLPEVGPLVYSQQETHS